MGLFDKKFCSVCGEKIGLLGNRKLEDGNLCKDCAGKLSPWFSDRRNSTVDEIKAQLAYREANQEVLAQFRPTLTMGGNKKIMLDEAKKQFVVTSASNLQNANPDVIDYSDVTGCELDVQEQKIEIKKKDADGKEVSYNPPRYRREYDFYIQIRVNNPYFDEIRFQLNDDSVESTSLTEYRKYEKMGEEIKAALLQARDDIREAAAAAAAPKQPVTCPACGAVTTPDANGCCEYCGSPLNA